MEESISLEETNKIRISLGLKPLTDDKEPALDADKVAEDNYAKLRGKEAKEREAKYASGHLSLEIYYNMFLFFQYNLGKYKIESRSKSLFNLQYFFASWLLDFLDPLSMVHEIVRMFTYDHPTGYATSGN